MTPHNSVPRSANASSKPMVRLLRLFGSCTFLDRCEYFLSYVIHERISSSDSPTPLDTVCFSHAPGLSLGRKPQHAHKSTVSCWKTICNACQQHALDCLDLIVAHHLALRCKQGPESLPGLLPLLLRVEQLACSL